MVTTGGLVRWFGPRGTILMRTRAASMTRRLPTGVTLAALALTLTACAPTFHPAVAPAYAPPYAPPPYAVPLIPEAPGGVPPTYAPPLAPEHGEGPPGAAPDAHAKWCDMQGTCYPSGSPHQIYHGDLAHPDRETGPPAPVTNPPPVVIPPAEGPPGSG
jgi:hypothetical protein